jgi:hypothetical protein
MNITPSQIQHLVERAVQRAGYPEGTATLINREVKKLLDEEIAKQEPNGEARFNHLHQGKDD